MKHSASGFFPLVLCCEKFDILYGKAVNTLHQRFSGNIIFTATTLDLKHILSINDIEELFRPITTGHFALKDGLLLEDIYKEIFSLESEEMEHLREDVIAKYERAGDTFTDENLAEEDREYLRLFALICELSFDVYLKKQMVEQMIDELREANPSKKKK